jgi:uncharacterized protein YkwD
VARTVLTDTTRTGHVSNSRLVLRCLAAAAIVTAAVIPMSLKRADAQATTDVPSEEAQFVTLINSLRADVGAGPLTLSAELDPVARAWTGKMVQQGDISHNPNLRAEVTAVTKNWKKLGENVGFDGSIGVDGLHGAFVKSPAHYRNLIDADFDKIAITIVYETADMQAKRPSDDACRTRPCFYVTEQFMDTKEQAATASAQPKSTDGSAPGQLALSKPKPAKAKPAKPKAKPKATKPKVPAAVAPTTTN